MKTIYRRCGKNTIQLIFPPVWFFSGWSYRSETLLPFIPAIYYQDWFLCTGIGILYKKPTNEPPPVRKNVTLSVCLRLKSLYQTFFVCLHISAFVGSLVVNPNGTSGRICINVQAFKGHNFIWRGHDICVLERYPFQICRCLPMHRFVIMTPANISLAL